MKIVRLQRFQRYNCTEEGRMIDLPTKKYAIIYADPPWDYSGCNQHTRRGTVNTGSAREHYPTVTTDDMMEWDIPSITEQDCLLFMWTSSPHLDQAIKLGTAWGFSYVTVAFVWDKQIGNPGYYTFSQCELCLVFKKGKIPQPRGARGVRQFLSEQRTGHSTKPAEIRKRIDLMFPEQNKLEMFARRSAIGWDHWGNEIEGEDVDQWQELFGAANKR